MSEHKSGLVALVGRPNAGKSTLLNALLGEKLAIVSNKPQTTRDRIVGIWSEDDLQAVLNDTPGLHEAWTELNKVMVKRAREALAEADVVLWVEDMALAAARMRQGKSAFAGAEDDVLPLLQASGRPVILAANKLDVIEPLALLPILAEAQKLVPLAAAVPLSAKTGDGVDRLKLELRAKLPFGPALYPKDTWTEATERFLVAEAIREQIFLQTKREIPYAAAVRIAAFDITERERTPRGLIKIRADILLERDSQKGIVIGQKGAMLKKIGTAARLAVEPILDAQVHLELYVKVEPDWSRSLKGLARAGVES
jgi:GTP-binding protein Era